MKNALQNSLDEIYPRFDYPAELRNTNPATAVAAPMKRLSALLSPQFLMIVVRNSYPKAIKRAAKQPIEKEESDLDKLIAIGGCISLLSMRNGMPSS